MNTNDWPNTSPPPPVENSPTNAPDAKIMRGAEKTEGVFDIGSGFVVPVNTGAIQQNTRFQSGVSGNPKGRPKGARNKFTETIMRTLVDDFAANGANVLATLRATNPEAYVRVMVSLLSKSSIQKYEQSFDIDFANITQDELVKLIDDVQRQKFIENTLESIVTD